MGDHETLNPGAEPIHKQHAEADDDMEFICPAFASRYMVEPIRADKFPKSSMPPKVVQRIIKDSRELDATPRLNLASFVTTWMEPEVNELILESLNINYIDESEYPSTTDIQNSCVAMLADLYYAESACGAATVGSSEAILLSGLALKRRWQEKRKAAGITEAVTPNIVCSSAVHVCWEKLFNYFEIEPRYVNLTETCFVAPPEKIAAACDKNTIGVVGILGTTYSGHYEDVAGIDAEISRLNDKNGWDIKIHIDGASGAFVVPFLYPDLKWDFRLKNVVSINASGHKYGLVYPGVGWVIFRSKDYLPESLVFHDNYLGTDQINFTLNFSKGASQIVAQYYQFLRLGRAGYTKIMQNCHAVAMYLQKALEDTGYFTIISARDPVPMLPLATFSLKSEFRLNGYDEFDVADRLRQRGWVVPAYTMAPGAESIRVLRVLCREEFSIAAAKTFVEDVKRAMEWLTGHFLYTPEQLADLKQKLAWKGVGKQAIKAIVKPGEPDLDAKQPNIPMHGGVC
ncbi:hypothetical protein CVIRNUC_010907 [Coccomyxa viridis]|uniref:Glutamate decarboxylase n=1 Tax=Coccomyxa viridis TaxID=1274662 RepID=A0AAV1INK4_9CHLO|nr:hypothetical protein CVIRNUC_010907 [Coccomyxa viridis]